IRRVRVQILCDEPDACPVNLLESTGKWTRLLRYVQPEFRMPSLTVPQVPRHVAPPPTKENLEYADLAIIDFAKVHTPEGRAELALEVRDALSVQGFFYIINHGLTQHENERIFDIADVPFNSVPDEEKRLYAADMKGAGSYQGYKMRSVLHIDNGVLDQLEHYNTDPHRATWMAVNHDIARKKHPKALQPLMPEIESFIKFNHFEVLHNILRLLAIGLELPEETFVDQHKFDVLGESYVRFTRYYPRTEEDEEKTKNVWLKGHTGADLGSVTILWSQPISALQILCSDGKWRWVKHIDNALVVNSGDAMDFLSGGFYKCTIHRVVQPPPDQRGLTRLGIFYFAMPHDDVKLVPRLDSPVLQRAGVKRRCSDDRAPTMKSWRQGRVRGYGFVQLKKREDGHEEEIVDGLPVTYFN
ncbi:hypothetical protein POSPLADRAFT_1157104, partial [Postia placenta MAD-698-R-SB12]